MEGTTDLECCFIGKGLPCLKLTIVRFARHLFEKMEGRQIFASSCPPPPGFCVLAATACSLVTWFLRGDRAVIAAPSGGSATSIVADGQSRRQPRRSAVAIAFPGKNVSAGFLPERRVVTDQLPVQSVGKRRHSTRSSVRGGRQGRLAGALEPTGRSPTAANDPYEPAKNVQKESSTHTVLAWMSAMSQNMHRLSPKRWPAVPIQTQEIDPSRAFRPTSRWDGAGLENGRRQ